MEVSCAKATHRLEDRKCHCASIQLAQGSTKTFSGSCEHWERVRKASDGREVSHSFVGLDIALRAVQPLVLLPQRPTPSAGLRFALPERLGVHPLRHPLFIYTTWLWEGKCC